MALQTDPTELAMLTRRLASLLLLTPIALLLLIPLSSPVLAADRLALVVGNSNYIGSLRLHNPSNDAADVAAALNRLGFEVILLIDADLEQMAQARRQLADRLARSRPEIALFYFAGHGIQYQGQNYLLPTDIRLRAPEQLPATAPTLDQFLAELSASAAQVAIALLDACRNNPFEQYRAYRSYLRAQPKSAGGYRQDRGLAPVASRPSTLIAFATAPGEVAEDGVGRNGTYTHHLLRHLERPGLDLQRLINRVGMDVQEATEDRQIPWSNSSPLPRLCLAGCDRDRTAGRFQLQARTDPGPNPTLHHGEQFRIEVRLNRPGYVYALGEIDPATGGEPLRYLLELYQGSDERRFYQRIDHPQRWVRFGSPFQVDAPYGRERFYLKATEQPPALPATYRRPGEYGYYVAPTALHAEPRPKIARPTQARPNQTRLNQARPSATASGASDQVTLTTRP